VPIAGAAESRNEFISAVDRLGELIPGNLKPRDVLVVTNTKPPESETPDSAFGRRNLP